MKIITYGEWEFEYYKDVHLYLEMYFLEIRETLFRTTNPCYVFINSARKLQYFLRVPLKNKDNLKLGFYI